MWKLTWDPGRPEGVPGEKLELSPMGEPLKKKNAPGELFCFNKVIPKNQNERIPMEHEKNTTKKSRRGKHFTYEDRVRLETFVRLLYPGGKKFAFPASPN